MSKSHVTFLDVNANINIILIYIVMNVKITLSMIEDQSINSDSSLLSDHANLGDRLQVTASGLLAPDWPAWTNPVSRMPGLSPGPVTVSRSSSLSSLPAPAL